MNYVLKFCSWFAFAWGCFLAIVDIGAALMLFAYGLALALLAARFTAKEWP